MTQRIKNALTLFLAIVALFNMPITSKTPYDEALASEIIKTSYCPVITLVSELKETDKSEYLEVPGYIRNKEDFVRFISASMEEDMAVDIFEDWIVEEGGQLYAKSSYYIPTIYDESRKITKAYISEKESLINKLVYQNPRDIHRELIIKERLKQYNTTYNKRTYYYDLYEDHNLILDHVNGTSSIGFVEASHNPWSQLWRTN